jgi:hypothetical protein
MRNSAGVFPRLNQFSMRLGCLSLRSALASIWRMRSRVTRELLADFLQRVVGVHADAEAHAQHALLARGERGQHARRRLAQVRLDRGIDRQIAFLSSMKSPRCESSSSPIGVSRLIGSLAIFITLRTFSSGMELSASSSGVGSRPISCSIWRLVRTSLLIVSIMCTGMRMVRA